MRLSVYCPWISKVQEAMVGKHVQALLAQADFASNPAVNDSTALIERLKPDMGVAEPVYRQLQRQIIQMIHKGELGEGYSLPSERNLADALKLSRTTIRRCYDELREQDYISTHGRAGVMIKAPSHIHPELGKLKDFTHDLQEIGLALCTQLVERQILCDRTMASVFNRPSTANFLRLVRLHLNADMPMTREVAWYDLTAAPALKEWDITGSPYSFLQQQGGLLLSHSEQTIEASMSNAEEMQVFGFTAPQPCLLFKRKTYTTTGQMVEYVEGTFRGDAYTYRLKLPLNASNF